MHRLAIPLVLLGSCTGSCSDDRAPVGDDTLAEDPQAEDAPTARPTVRIATFNVSLYRDAAGALRTELQTADDSNASIAAAILQEVRPDIVLLNEVDFDATGQTVDALRTRFLEVGQDGREPLSYPHVYVPEVNTGVASGADLDGDGNAAHPEGTQAYGADTKGFGLFPGQYGMVVLSRFPIEGARTFRDLLWKDMPDALLPAGYYSTEAQAVLPLSSKTHADVSIDVDGTTVHLLISHPTPPSFDGSEDRNGRRNHDEIRFWTDYIEGQDWMVDDDGGAGGLDEDAAFVVLGDLNSDPADGDSRYEAIRALLSHPRTTDAQPASEGAVAQAIDDSDKAHRGPARLDTADFGPGVGNLRVDHVVPSTGLDLQDAGVFWPTPEDPRFALVGTHPFPLTDHRLVWVDVVVP